LVPPLRTMSSQCAMLLPRTAHWPWPAAQTLSGNPNMPSSPSHNPNQTCEGLCSHHGLCSLKGLSLYSLIFPCPLARWPARKSPKSRLAVSKKDPESLGLSVRIKNW
jgi:hypothetical protein